jgi:hypothetical protein
VSGGLSTLCGRCVFWAFSFGDFSAFMAVGCHTTLNDSPPGVSVDRMRCRAYAVSNPPTPTLTHTHNTTPTPTPTYTDVARDSAGAGRR